MQSHRKELRFHVSTERAFINITRDVQAAVREIGIQEGVCHINAMHITASVFSPMTMNRGSTATMNAGSKTSLRTRRSTDTITISPERTVETPISTGRSWGEAS